MPNLLKKTFSSFKKTEGEGTLPNSFYYEASSTLIPKPDKDTLKKLQANNPDKQRSENLPQNTTIATRIQQHVKRTIPHDHWRRVPGKQDGSTRAGPGHSMWLITSKTWRRKVVIISAHTVKGVTKFNILLHKDQAHWMGECPLSDQRNVKLYLILSSILFSF